MLKKLAKHSENKWAILAVLAVAQFMVVLDVSIVNVALPSIARSLDFAANNLQWVVTAYALTFGGFLLLGGRAADLYGRRVVFISAVTAFFLMSLFCGLAQTETQLILARAAQGLAGAFMSPAALSIVLSEFKEGKERNSAMGVWAAVAAGGAAVGVLLGGVLTEYLGWRWNFFVNVPVGVLVALVSFKLLPKHIGEENKAIKLDLVGAATATGGLMSLVYGLSKAPSNGWHSDTVLGFLAFSALLLTIFVYNERRVAQPLLPFSLFKIRNVLGSNLALLTIASSLFSMFFFLTLYVQQVLGYSPIKAGLCFLPITFVIGITSGIVSKLVGKIGYKPPMQAGPIVLAIGLFVLSQTMEVGGNYWNNVLPGILVFSIGMGLTFVSGTLAATSGVPRHFSGIASGVLSTSQQVGGAIGLAILSAVAFSAVKSDVMHGSPPLVSQVNGYKDAIHVAIVLALIGALSVAVFVKNHKVDAHGAMVAS